MELHSSLESLNQIMHRERYCAVSYSNVELLKKRPGKVAVLYCTGELVNQIMSSFRAEVQYGNYQLDRYVLDPEQFSRLETFNQLTYR
jgi:hypothetical protein